MTTTVYNPAVPLRCLFVWCEVPPPGHTWRDDETNDLRHEEQPVVGVQCIADDDGEVAHVPVIWVPSIYQAVPLGSPGAELVGWNFRRVVGPKDMPGDWWEDETFFAEQDVLNNAVNYVIRRSEPRPTGDELPFYDWETRSRLMAKRLLGKTV